MSPSVRKGPRGLVGGLDCWSYDGHNHHVGADGVILFYSILFYSILFYSILFYSILFYSILFYSILFYSILFYSILFYFILFYFDDRQRNGMEHGTSAALLRTARRRHGVVVALLRLWLVPLRM